jgi:hypothetical protein
LNLRGQPAEPRQERARPVLFPVKDDSDSGHSVLVYSQTCENANSTAAHQRFRIFVRLEGSKGRQA